MKLMSAMILKISGRSIIKNQTGFAGEEERMSVAHSLLYRSPKHDMDVRWG